MRSEREMFKFFNFEVRVAYALMWEIVEVCEAPSKEEMCERQRERGERMVK